MTEYEQCLKRNAKSQRHEEKEITFDKVDQ